MKKRILSVLILCALTLALAGCGGKTESPAPTSESTESAEPPTTQEGEDAAAAADEKQEQTKAATIATAESTAEIVEEEPPREIKNITNYNSFRFGTLFFEIDNTDYVYDVLENKMYDYDSEKLGNIYYACGKLATDGKATTNLETMETYDAQFMYYEYFGLKTYNPVYSVKEDFDGNTYSFGVIGSNGEWVLPMSTEYSVCELLKSTKYLSVYKTTSSFVVLCDSSYNFYSYNYKTDETVELDNLLKSNGYVYFIGSYALLLDDYSFSDGQYIHACSLYNIETNETTKLDGTYVDFEPLDSSVLLKGLDESTIFILDSQGNIHDYDLSEYNVRRMFNVTENYIVFAAKNTDGDTYTIILDKNGNRVVDPIKGASSTVPSIYGDYVIYTSSNYIVNCKTGEMKTYSDDSLSLEEFDSTSGKLLMKSDGAYYLADLADPETLINPFEQ